MFFHSSFRDWLVRRERDESDIKFSCDVRYIKNIQKLSCSICRHYYFCLVANAFENRTGNSAIALRLTSIEAPLSPSKTLELAHHILKAGIFKPSLMLHNNARSNIPNKELQAIWLLTATKDIGSAIVSFSNVYAPNSKVQILFTKYS